MRDPFPGGRAAAQAIAHVMAVHPLGPGMGQVDVEAPHLGEGLVCGQFAMLSVPGRPEGVLPRPYSYFRAPDPQRVSFLVKAVGAGTQAMLSAQVGDPIAALGPLGQGFPEPPPCCWVVAGGVGAAPFGLLRYRPGLRVFLGSRSIAESGYADVLSALGASVCLATDDGSGGYHGSVVALLEDALAREAPPQAIWTCGPTGMMAAVAHQAHAHQIPCWVSLEARMACGIGVCRGCAHPDATGGWRCICVEGPVYNACDIFGDA